jgi:hypothetical protein
MTVERTRQIFGAKMESWTDEQVLQFIKNMSIICDELLKTALTSLKEFNKTEQDK